MRYVSLKVRCLAHSKCSIDIIREQPCQWWWWGGRGGSFGSSGYYKCVSIQSFLAPVVEQLLSPTLSVWSRSNCPAVRSYPGLSQPFIGRALGHHPDAAASSAPELLILALAQPFYFSSTLSKVDNAFINHLLLRHCTRVFLGNHNRKVLIPALRKLTVQWSSNNK